MFVRNAWYVAGRSADFGRDLAPLKILEEPVVVYRTIEGAPVALEDACPHRKVPLSMGSLDGDRVVCGYHGLTFDCSGSCVAAPTQPHAVPRRAGVKSYPAVDRYGLLWLWMGDPDRAAVSEIIDIPHFDDATWGRTEIGAMDVACNYLWITDNLLDPSHVAWVHVTSFAGAGTEDEPLQTTLLDDGLVVWRWMKDRPPPPYYAPRLAFEGNCDRKQHYEVRTPSIAINKSVFTPVGTGGDDENLPPEAFVNLSYNFMTPVDEGTSRYFWFQHRNALADDAEVSRQMFEGAKAAFLEDKAILEAVQKGMERRRTPPLNLGLDAGAMKFRKMIERRIAEEAPAA